MECVYNDVRSTWIFVNVCISLFCIRHSNIRSCEILRSLISANHDLETLCYFRICSNKFYNKCWRSANTWRSMSSIWLLSSDNCSRSGVFENTFGVKFDNYSFMDSESSFKLSAPVNISGSMVFSRLPLRCSLAKNSGPRNVAGEIVVSLLSSRYNHQSFFKSVRIPDWKFVMLFLSMISMRRLPRRSKVSEYKWPMLFLLASSARKEKRCVMNKSGWRLVSWLPWMSRKTKV